MGRVVEWLASALARDETSFEVSFGGVSLSLTNKEAFAPW